MKVSDDVYMSLYGSYTYIFQLKKDKSYLFNEIVYDIITSIHDNPGIDCKGICEKLLEIYECADENELSSDISDCMEMLEQKGIVIDDSINKAPESFQKSPEDCLNTYCIENKILHSVTIELTYRCNEKCSHCYVSDSEKNQKAELTTAQVFGLLDDLRNNNVLNITLTGGEVALRKDFIEILKYAVKCGFVISIFTNGIGFSEEEIDSIIECHPRAVSCSLYSGIPSEHDSITHVSGSYERTLYFLMRLKCADIMVNVKTPVMRATIDGFESLHKLCKQLNFQHQVSYLICSTNKGCMSPTKLRVGDLEKYKILMRIANDGMIEKREPRDIHAPICGAGFCTLSINPYGDVFPCNGYCVPLGNVLKDKIQDIWSCKTINDIRSISFESLNAECLNCKYIDECLYCPGAMLIENGDIRKPIPEVCIISQAAYEINNEIT